MSARSASQRGVLAARLVLVALAAAAAVAAWSLSRSPLRAFLIGGEPVGFVMMGTSRVSSKPRLDLVFAGHMDPASRCMTVAALPASWRTEGGPTLSSIFQSSGASAVAAEVRGRLALPEPSLHVAIDLPLLARAVDRLGGVTIALPEPVRIETPALFRSFDRSAGPQQLGGAELLAYLAHLARPGDPEAWERWRLGASALVALGRNPAAWWRSAAAMRFLREGVATDIRAVDAPALLALLARHGAWRHRIFVLPGRMTGQGWVLDAAISPAFVARLGAGSPPSPDAGALSPVTRVWNASGQRGLAYDLTRHLRAVGVDVLDWSNFSAILERSRIVARTSDIENAERVAALTGRGFVYAEADPAALVDVDVYAGRDLVPGGSSGADFTIVGRR